MAQTTIARAGKTGGAVALLLVAAALGYALALAMQSGGGSAASPTTAIFAEKSAGSAGAPAATANGATGQSAAPDGVTASPQRYVVVNSQMDLEVRDASAAVSAVRRIAGASGTEIASLQFSAGSVEPSPVPLAAGGRAAQSLSPASAQITLRVPAEKLASVQSQLAALGSVTSQSASQSDATQQHVDMAARLRNLRAEEAQLRAFYAKARNVTELLAVQQQLAGVRGEIESMQAQLDYLERQAALATLTISVTEPGPIVRPSGGGWGFSAAVTSGVQAAAALVRALITVTIALVPVIVTGLLLWGVWSVIRRRRAAALPLDDAPDGSE